MIKAIDVVKASLRASWDTLRPKYGGDTKKVNEQLPAIVPIRSLGANQRGHIETHLLTLDSSDRYLRFGYAIQDEQIHLYVEGLNFGRDEVFGIFDRKLTLLAVAHLAFGEDQRTGGCAEFGVSVLRKARGRGYGARLFERAAMHAGNQGVHTMYIHALSENTAMLKIARAAGARVKREGGESEAYLQLPQATLNSRMTEIVHGQIAEADYRLKRHARQLRNNMLIRQDVLCAAGIAPKDQPL